MAQCPVDRVAHIDSTSGQKFVIQPLQQQRLLFTGASKGAGGADLLCSNRIQRLIAEHERLCLKNSSLLCPDAALHVVSEGMQFVLCGPEGRTQALLLRRYLPRRNMLLLDVF